MELDEFLEKDIIHFLEERKEKKTRGPTLDREEDYGLYLTKDYLKEVTRALEKDEITEAQKLFDELRAHYDTLPKTSLEAKKIYSILEQIYSKINAYNQLRGNVQSIKTFDDVLGKGFQGSIPQKIHQTTTKIDKKIDTIDEKLTNFGKDVKELKHTILDSSIPAVLVAKGQAIYLKNSKINILPPDAPKDSKPFKKPIEEKNAPETKRELSVEMTQKPSMQKISVEKKPSVINSDIKTKEKIPEKNNSDYQSQQYQSQQSPYVKKNNDKKGIHLYKIPKVGRKKKLNSKIPEDIFAMKSKKGENKSSGVPLLGSTDNSSIFKIQPEKKPESKPEKNPAAKNAGTVVENILLPGIKLPSPPEIESGTVKEQIPGKENDIEKFDSPFQEPKPIIPSKEPDVTAKKSTAVKAPSNEYEEIYSDALREFSLRNYEGASKLFMKVLEIKPKHKASIIRLKQCEEAMHNA